MKIPKYVVGIMERSEFVLGYGYPGYTIKIHKATCYTLDNTINKEAERLVAFARRSGAVAYVNKYVRGTRHFDQTAEVTIFDPVMQQIEKYMNYNNMVRYDSFAAECGDTCEEKYGNIYCSLVDMEAAMDNIIVS